MEVSSHTACEMSTASADEKKKRKATSDGEAARPQLLRPYDESVRNISVHVEDLHPTQMCVGFASVHNRQVLLEQMYAQSREYSFRHWFKKKWTPVVYGPPHPRDDGEQKNGGRKVLYLVDRHHTARALLRSQLIAEDDKLLVCKVQGDLSHLSFEAFFEELTSRLWCYLPCRGKPVPLSELPVHIGELGNDVFRSLAAVAKMQAWEKRSNVPFIEFQWADYLRECPEFEDIDDNASIRELMDKYGHLLLEVCSREQASHLPGFKKKKKKNASKRVAL